MIRCPDRCKSHKLTSDIYINMLKTTTSGPPILLIALVTRAGASAITARSSKPRAPRSLFYPPPPRRKRALCALFSSPFAPLPSVVLPPDRPKGERKTPKIAEALHRTNRTRTLPYGTKVARNLTSYGFYENPYVAVQSCRHSSEAVRSYAMYVDTV